jgi:hypothetical protein
MSLWVSYQCTHAEVASSMSASVRSGPARNGDPSDAFGLVEPNGCLCQGVVEGVTDDADRGRQPGQHQCFGEMYCGVL